MAQKIERDFERFRKILKGKLRKDLKNHIVRGGMVGKEGKKEVVIPLPGIDLPYFKYGKQDKGIGQGEGEEGEIIDQQTQPGEGEAGDGEGQHLIELDVSIDDLLELMEEVLELPRIEQKGKKNIVEEIHKYTGIRSAGPESLRHNKRTYIKALKREIASGNYDPDNPIIIPVREDKMYRAMKTFTKPEANAVIFYLMDVSGSMGDEQKEIVRIESFWIDRWLRANYDGLDSEYIIHDSLAKKVDRHTFFHTRESGGTIISSGYKVIENLIKSDYSPNDYNIYVFQFSDGDNWTSEDSDLCVRMLEDNLLASVNLWGYGQVKSPYGSGQFIKELGAIENEKLILSEILDREGIMDSIGDFFKPGK